jgi:phage N-6-adenine-methyltransferase
MSDEWRTPPELLKVLWREFPFDLDAAASLENCVVGLGRIDVNSRYKFCITPEEDALVTPWKGQFIWCNPPYTQIGPFIKRGYEQHIEQKNTVVMLLPAYTDPKYWSEYVMRAHEVRFLKGRLSFIDEDGMKKTSARFPSVVVVFKWITGEHYGKAPSQWVWDWRAV